MLVNRMQRHHESNDVYYGKIQRAKDWLSTCWTENMPKSEEKLLSSVSLNKLKVQREREKGEVEVG